MTPLLIWITATVVSQPLAPVETRVPIDCTVSTGTELAPVGTTAMTCLGLRGFFVARDTYLTLRQFERQHPFLKNEISILERKANELEKAGKAAERQLGAVVKARDTYRKSWLEAEGALTVANKAVVEAASLTMWERLLYTGLGAAVVIGAAYAIKPAR